MKFLPAYGPGAFRFLLALVVVLHHSSPVRMGHFAVYAFFILSGYWIARMWDAKYSKFLYPRRTFVISRWWRLAPVFIACTILGVLFLEMPVVGLSGHVQWGLRQLPIIGSAFGDLLLPPIWSLDVEMQFYVVAAVVLAAIPMSTRGSHYYLAVVVVLALLGCALFLVSGGYPETPRVWVFGGFFLAGALLWKSTWHPSRTTTTISISILLCLVVIAFLIPEFKHFVWRRGGDVNLSFDPRWHWGGLFQLVCALLAVPFIARNVRVPSTTWDRMLGNWAYPLYLFHWIPREVYYNYLDWSKPVWFVGLLFAANIGFALLGSFAILHWIDRPIDKKRTAWLRARALKSHNLESKDKVFA